MNFKAILLAAAVIGTVGVYHASNWWERAFATLESSELSPDGCIRVDTYRPFWVLPSILHRIPHPDPEASPIPLGNSWDYPMFARAHEVGTNTVLGESIVYDAAVSFGGMHWDVPSDSGRRVVSSDGFRLLNSDRCADDATMAKITAYHEKKRREYPARMKEWDEYERQWREEEKEREEQEHLLRIEPPAGAGK